MTTLVENKQLQKVLIEKISNVDIENQESIFKDIMFKGFKGYNNLNDRELIKIFIEYFGISELDRVFKEVAEGQAFSWDNFKHIAYNHDLENECDLYINYFVDEFEKDSKMKILYAVFQDGNCEVDTKDLEVALSYFGMTEKELNQ